MKRVILVASSLILLSLFLPSPALALGVAMGPQTLEITNALRGGEYESTVTIFNPSKAEDTYKVGAEGQAAGWLSFYQWENKKAFQTLAVAGESNTDVLVKVKVPADTPNGTYTATIYAQSAPANAGSMGASIGVRANSHLTIGVTGTEIVSGTVSNISAITTEAGLPLRVETNFQNTGNVAVRPQINCQISKGDSKVAELGYSNTTVKPNSQEIIPVDWTTKADQAGDYVAHVTVSVGDKVIATKEIPFQVVPSGTFTKQGELTGLAYEGEPLLGTMLKIQAAFQNTGQAHVRASLMAEVYCDGSLIDTIKSEESLVAVGQTGTLTSYLKLTKVGKYTIKGHVSYEGKQTEVKELSITATATATNTNTNAGTGAEGSQPSTFPLWLPMIAAGVIASLVVVIVLLLARSKRRVVRA